MRILHLIDRLTDRGGARRHLLGVLEALQADGHDVLLTAGSGDETLAPPSPVAFVPGLDARTAVPVRDALETVARAFAPDMIHVHTVVNPDALVWAAGRAAVATVQDHRYFCPGRGKWTRKGTPCAEALRPELCADCFDDRDYADEIYALTRARLEALRSLNVIVLSRYMARELVAAGLGPERIVVVPPFVHGLDPHAAADGPPCVVFVGRLTEAKGLEDALAAWSRAGLGLPLVVAGRGPLHERAQHGGAETVGWLDRAGLSRLLRRARALVLPSRWQEPFGIVGLEALTMGVPVAAWDSGGVREWHPGAPGLVPWGDVDGLAGALGAVAGQPAARPVGFETEPLMLRLLAVYEGARSEFASVQGGIGDPAWATMGRLETAG